jgi:2-phospho-L-lactate/phosphoenolpyruvate guanylyltransferase
MILVPVKNLAQAKERLSSLLAPAERRALAEAMLRDVCQALASWPSRPPAALVTGDPCAHEIARAHSLQVIDDPAGPGETAVIEMATRAAQSAGAQFTLVVPADIPLLDPRDLARILAAAPAQGSVLVAAGDGRGTNAVLRRPASLFPLRFGNDSFLPHLRAARSSGKPCIVLDCPSLALDVDNPADLYRLLDAPGDTRAQRLARAWDLGRRALAAS